MRKFLIKAVAFVVLFFLLDKLAYFILNRAPKYAYDPRLELIMEGKINSDIIIAGSSRGAKGIIAKQIEDSTGYTAYNLCFNATDVVYHEFIVRS